MLTYRPIVPGSDHHLVLLQRAQGGRKQLGAVLYPDLFHRRACEELRAAAARVSNKRETPPAGTGEASEPTSTPDSSRSTGGRSIQCQ